METSMLKRLEATKIRLEEIDKELMDERVTSDIRRFRELSKERSNLEPIVDEYEKYLKISSDIKDAEIMMNDADSDIAQFGHDEHKRLLEEEVALVERVKILLLPKDPNDDKNIIVEIRGAAGGDEGNIFAGDLFRMYTRYAEHQGWKIQMLDESISEAGGYSFVSFMIKHMGWK